MIARDGSRTSLWQEIEAYESRPERAKDIVYDVIIVGGGITGVSTALRLQEAGKQCLLLEAANLGFGTTGGTTAHLNTLLDTPYSTIEKKFSKEVAAGVAGWARAAIDMITENISRYGIQCDFKEMDACLYAVNESQAEQLKEIEEAAIRAGLTISAAGQIPIPGNFTKAISVKKQARFSPLKYVFSLAQAFEEKGGTIKQDCRVTGYHDEETVRVETEKSEFKASNLVFATHIPPGINLLHLRCAPYRSYAIAVKLKDNLTLESLVYDMEDPYHYYRTHPVDGINYLVAGGKDHKTGTEKNTPYRFTELEALVRKKFSVEEISYSWSSQYYEPVDGLPYIGTLPGHSSRVLTATGFGGNGMIYSQVAAMILSSTILNKADSTTEIFRPGRIKPIAGFKDFVSHNANVVKELAAKPFSGEKLSSLAEIAAGEGRVIKYEGNKIAICKDEKGQVHTLSPSCSHMQCDVQWNGAEESWDCPCHGARYAMNGQVITGPSYKGLEQAYLIKKPAK
ncbi:MAG TPA: FAD-dependent oxidoreductase [Chitinophagaceae bacterium]|nr:FAD-dependent oxidoreductase [Chitinophagaceae bacterium]